MAFGQLPLTGNQEYADIAKKTISFDIILSADNPKGKWNKSSVQAISQSKILSPLPMIIILWTIIRVIMDMKSLPNLYFSAIPSGNADGLLYSWSYVCLIVPKDVGGNWLLGENAISVSNIMVINGTIVCSRWRQIMQIGRRGISQL